MGVFREMGKEWNKIVIFVWYDGEIGERAKEVINELKVERKVLLQENYALKRRLDALCRGGMWTEVDAIMNEVRQMKKITEEEETHAAELAKARKQLKIVYNGLLVLCILAFGIGMFMLRNVYE